MRKILIIEFRLVMLGCMVFCSMSQLWAIPLSQVAREPIVGTMPAQTNTWKVNRINASSKMYSISNERIHTITSANSAIDFSLYKTSTARKECDINMSMSGGVSAVGLMSSGSRYISSVKDDITNSTDGTANIHGGPHRTPPDPLDPHLTPVGDIAWPLMILLAIGYIFFTIRGKRKARQ